MIDFKVILLALLGICLLNSASAYTIFCHYPYPVPQNINGAQGVVVNGCSGSVSGNTAVRIGHFECGNAVLNVALIINGNVYGPIRVAPGEKNYINNVERGFFGVKISLQSGSASSCRLEVLYVWGKIFKIKRIFIT